MGCAEKTYRPKAAKFGERRFLQLRPALPLIAFVGYCSMVYGSMAFGSQALIEGTHGDDRLVGTPGIDYFVGGEGADVFVINYLSARGDEIADFEPEEGDTIELTFESVARVPFRNESFSINRKGVVKIKFGNEEQEVVRLNRSDLRLEIDPRKGRYFLKFSKKF